MNLIKMHKETLKQRVEDGELEPSSKPTYENGAAKVLEALVGILNDETIIALIDAWGAKGENYTPAIHQLRQLALERKGQPKTDS